MVVPRMTLSGSGAWMGTAINLFEMVDAHVSVALRGGEARMPEHLLDRAQIGARVEQVCGEAMTQSVRRDRGSESRRHDAPGQDVFDRARRQPTGAQVGDYGAVEFPRLRHRAPPGLERVERRLTDRHHPILVALARAHQHPPDLVVDVAPVEPGKLAHAEAGGVERLEDRTVTQSG